MKKKPQRSAVKKKRQQKRPPARKPPGKPKTTKADVRIATLITPMPHTIGPKQSLAKAHAIMRGANIRHLPVLDGGKLVGIVTERDLHLVETFKDVDPDEVPVEEAMTSEPYAVRYDVPLSVVAKTMADRKYGAAIVVDDDGQVVGVFTTTDALRALI